MAHPSGAGSRDDLRLDFDRRVRLECRGTQLSSDGGLLLVRELDDALGLSDLASWVLVWTCFNKVESVFCLCGHFFELHRA
jgi:hypothetical protein